ncbi:MAG: hypothetical protein HFJ28_02370 [Clostridia bacterium]|jgi:hypothetical protein|nr:hypothetical protein [Clostridia bacterium]
MFGKIVQLIGNPQDKSLNRSLDIVYGITPNQANRIPLNFGEIVLSARPSESQFALFGKDFILSKIYTYIYGGHSITDKGDGFKEIAIFNGLLSVHDVEKYLLVVIPHAPFDFSTTGKKIAGRYPYEGIIELRAGDAIRALRNAYGEFDVFMAVQAGNELFLLKKGR